MDSSNTTPGQSAAKKIMNQQLPKGGSGTSIQRHVNYRGTADKLLTNGQRNANAINDNGQLRKVACAPCLAAIQNFDKNFRTGRGQSEFNEYFACIVYGGLGVGGTQCGRCVGLGSGGKCVDPPEHLRKLVAELIKALPAYNKALRKTENQAYSELSRADQTAIDNAVVASKKFDLAWKGAIKSGVAATPTKKRKFDAFQTPTKELSTLQQSTNDTRSDVGSVSMQVRTLATQVTSLRESVGELRTLLRNGRERERWLVEAVQGVVNHLNRKNAAKHPLLNPDGTAVEPPPAIQVDDFDLTHCVFEDEVGEEENSDDSDT